MSPRDAKLLPPLDPSKPKQLAGFEKMHFGAFFDRAGRENDYLWGRLDGAERLIGLVLGAGLHRRRARGLVPQGVRRDRRGGGRRARERQAAARPRAQLRARLASPDGSSQRACHTLAIVSPRATEATPKRRAVRPGVAPADLEKLVQSFQLAKTERHFISSRWLENVLWMEAAAQRTRTRYYALRLTTIVGAVIVPALVSINAVGGTKAAITWLTFAVSLVVALSAAVEGFFRFGDRWRHYRSLVEELKSEGWNFHELSGPYRADGATHETAFPSVRRARERAARPRDADLHLGDREPGAGDRHGRRDDTGRVSAGLGSAGSARASPRMTRLSRSVRR